MSIPAIRALKESFNCRITLLTSPAGGEAAKYVEEVDDVISYNAPWNRLNTISKDTSALIALLKSRSFDAAVVFTVYSQNPLPAAMLAYMADIPRRLAYCRENPYHLLTHWIPDEEPYFNIIHQVARDMKLVAEIGAVTQDDRLHLSFSESAWRRVRQKMSSLGADSGSPWILLHAGVSEKKRAYPQDQWAEAGRLIRARLEPQLLLTGTREERSWIERIGEKIGRNAFCLAGMLDLEEFIALIGHAPLVISVNTATIHIAAATGTPLVVLYALTNPQHTPWKTSFRLLPFHPPEELRSKNQVVKFVYKTLLRNIREEASPRDIARAAEALLEVEESKKAFY